MFEKKYRELLIHRYDEDGITKYFKATDFKGLKDEPYKFKSGQNTLSGHFYYYSGCNDKLVIFCHGIACGHIAYTAEINTICKQGYKVFAYDNTGCCDSEGQDIVCFGHSVLDLDSAIKSLKADGLYGKFSRVFVIGHSQGAFAASNILRYHTDISKAVVISGFVSVKRFFDGYLKGFAKLVEPFILNFEKKASRECYELQADKILNNTKTPVMIIHSKDDEVVSFKENTEYLKKVIKNKNVKFLIVNGKHHNPNLTKSAVNRQKKDIGKLMSIKSVEGKKEFSKKLDWKKMVVQDLRVWEKIFRFLEN